MSVSDIDTAASELRHRRTVCTVDGDLLGQVMSAFAFLKGLNYFQCNVIPVVAVGKRGERTLIKQ